MRKNNLYTAREVSLLLGEKDAQIEEMKCRLKALQERRPRWFRIGEMETGEGIYCDGPGELAIMKEHRYLVEPTQEEMQELRGGKCLIRM